MSASSIDIRFAMEKLQLGYCVRVPTESGHIRIQARFGDGKYNLVQDYRVEIKRGDDITHHSCDALRVRQTLYQHEDSIQIERESHA